VSYKNSLPILLADFIKLFSSIADFGKSLFVDTFKEAFEDNKELFKGLYL